MLHGWKIYNHVYNHAYNHAYKYSMVQFMSCVHGKPYIFELKNINMKKIWSNNKRSDANRISEYKENYVNYFNTCPVLKVQTLCAHKHFINKWMKLFSRNLRTLGKNAAKKDFKAHNIILMMSCFFKKQSCCLCW